MSALQMRLRGPRLLAAPVRRQASADPILEGMAESGSKPGLSSRSSLVQVTPYSGVCLGLGAALIFPKERGHSVKRSALSQTCFTGGLAGLMA